MIPSVVLILRPQLDQGIFLTLCTEMLEKSPARKADTAGLTGMPLIISMLSEFSGTQESDIYDLLQFGCLIAADERDTPAILEVASGMQFALTDTIIRGVQAILVSGTFKQWISAVKKGCRKDQPTDIRACYDRIYLGFCKEGLGAAFKGVKTDLPDHTFYLTDERGR